MKALSGKFVLRISPNFHHLLRQQATKAGLSLNEVCNKILTHSLRETKSPFGFYSELIPQSFLDHIIKKWGDKLSAIILFGSAMRGQLTQESDLDLLLVLNPSCELDRSLYHEWELFYQDHKQELVNPWEISPQFVKLPQDLLQAGSLWYEAAIEGTLLWQKDDQVFQFLQKLRAAMAEGKIQRQFSHGHPYWIKYEK